jgi:anti-sigma factor RsiW
MAERRHPGAALSAFLDDELVEEEALEVARHVDTCGRCQQELEDIRASRAALRGLPAVAPPITLFDDVAAVAAAADAAGRTARAATFVFAGVLTLLVVAFAVGDDRPGSVVPPVEFVVVDHVVRTGGGPVIAPVDLSRR